MNEDLKKIKKLYGENMMHLCRDLFPTILEQEGLLPRLMTTTFNPSKTLYDDIKAASQETNFKDYIYNLIEIEKNYVTNTQKSPKELLSEAGYDLYECYSEEDIQSFKKYYAYKETLCTFGGGRLDKCHVFFAVKKNVDAIKREDFPHPQRQDEYGTSVISIQFTRGDINTLSIKNRYNHTVDNPDATFSNNLENIIPGLTKSFEHEYGFKINQNRSSSFELPNYVQTNDGRFYKYNYEINNIYYCPNNIIIDEFNAQKLEPEKYILLDYFILDLQNKTIQKYDRNFYDSFAEEIQNIEDIKVVKNQETSNKEISITTKDNNLITIEINKDNQIISYKNPKVKKIGNDFLRRNKTLLHLELDSVEEIAFAFLYDNTDLTTFIAPRLKKVDNHFLYSNKKMTSLELPSLETIDSHVLHENQILKKFNAPNIMKIGNSFLVNNKKLTEFNAPLLYIVGDFFLLANNSLKTLSVPNLVYAGKYVLTNSDIELLELPSLIQVGPCFMQNNYNLKTLIMPSVKKIGTNILFYNQDATTFYAPNLCDDSIRELTPHLRNIISKQENIQFPMNNNQSETDSLTESKIIKLDSNNKISNLIQSTIQKGTFVTEKIKKIIKVSGGNH